jgi:predicted naringenin-chalcone synthase
MRSPVVLAGFLHHLPRYGRPQEEGAAWLVAAHARSAATAEGPGADLPRLTGRMARLVGRYACPPEHIRWRCSELGDFMHTDWSAMQIFNLEESQRGRGMEARNRFFAAAAGRVVGCLFSAESEAPADLLHVTCTGYSSPSAIQKLVDAKHWHRRTRLTQVYHQGCYAAVPAVRLASAMVGDGAGASARAEIVHTELCTLHFDPSDHSPEQLVVQSLFADGHIRYAVTSGRAAIRPGALELLAVGEEMIPGSLDHMTWVLSDHCFRMTLSIDVPGRIAGDLEMFLSRLFRRADLDYGNEAGEAVFAVHPGGPRILDSVRELLSLDERQIAHSRKVLLDRGNMSSATLPHIWMAIASDEGVRSGSLVVSLAFGPGLTIAATVFRKC